MSPRMFRTHVYEISRLEMDHTIARKKFKAPTEADKLITQQLLCTECHRAKTKTDLKVLSRMR